MNASPPPPLPPSVEAIAADWEGAWPQALETWSKFTRLRNPKFCLTREEAAAEGLAGSFAMIRLRDQAIIVSIPEVVTCGVRHFAVEVLAHEIGHHVLAPATLSDHARCLARMRWALPTLEQHAPMVANLYTDLLINDRLQRSANLRLAEVYLQLGQDKQSSGAVWALYTRIYEVLWRLERGSLQGGKIDDRIEGDAWLGARLVRSFARDWLDGAGRFACLLLPHLLEDQASQARLQKWFDTQNACNGGNPSGLTIEDPDERTGAIHPAADPTLTGEGEITAAELPGDSRGPKDVRENLPARGQHRQPFEYGELLRALGIVLTDHEIAVRYYRERAQPHLVRFPTRRAPEQLDPLPEGLEPWDFGHPLDTVDWVQSVLLSPRIIPGMTTVQRVWGNSPGSSPETKPLDLDLYVDSSGSMPHPQRLTSYLTLAGAIIALSALRVGARVQVTLWSGKKQFESTDGFTRNETDVLRILTGFYGGGTAFPVHVLRETYHRRKADAPPAHIMVISDDGVTTLFDRDEQGASGWEVSADALRKAKGGGTLVLNLPDAWDAPGERRAPYQQIRRARDEAGWNVHAVSSWEQLVEFARQFSRIRYSETAYSPAAASRKKPSALEP